MTEYVLWSAAVLFLLLQVPPLLGVLAFRVYVKRSFDEESGGDGSEAAAIQEPSALPDLLDRRAHGEDASSFGYAHYLRRTCNLLQGARIRLIGLPPLRQFFYTPGKRKSARYTPKVSIILPCKGMDPGFQENMRSIIEQEYPDFEMIFVTATDDDPARECLEGLLKERASHAARLVTAGIVTGRSQKLNNQLEALKHVRPETEVLVFMDSDIRAHPRFLQSLVEPLGQPERKVGATTGFRWYIPQKGGAGSYLRAAWNGGGLPILTRPDMAYAWGGAMALRRADFYALGIPQKWQTALTDDFPLTDAVHKRGTKREIFFVPRCLVASFEDSSFRQTIEWTNRQTIICRVYNPKLWWVLFLSHAVQSVAWVLGGALVLARVFGVVRGIPLMPAALLFAAIPLQVGFGLLLWRTVRKCLLPEIGGWGKAFKHALLVPAVIFLIFYNSVHSLCTREICWRGARYRLHSASHTEVLDMK